MHEIFEGEAEMKLEATEEDIYAGDPTLKLSQWGRKRKASEGHALKKEAEFRESDKSLEEVKLDLRGVSAFNEASKKPKL
mmetsp:Transcript_10096/g.7571  ORF Transcript_10096/g.7571 Transcript_10096/m.7571 type:complete len:80 (+) Transcript_10096:225-464(+)